MFLLFDQETFLSSTSWEIPQNDRLIAVVLSSSTFRYESVGKITFAEAHS